ncbi:GNAT family N-acetyltransferase [Paenibacillus sacheonensis]|uniref:GNAT family N-acetyltransferase n=1 Tax=Paenibacillus sacheonensis TaxID=742054 RepID=A0A7X4YM11_9BACL|nr:GNAT family N-acetyltransferase [Paenibacillus sacheonensis]MBM7563354.1 ribosomal protein S18 acetylase RimI-like enzyme [Paenibacillus sacheonensis]NBC68091.1 GNAT family N-acetyltransferase [Paenibacillus sacheonensis]
MNKQMMVYLDGKPIEIVIRNYTHADFANMIDIQRQCFPPPFPSELWWNEAQLKEHVTRFPDGALCAELDGRLIGSITGLKVDDEQLHGAHSWESITDGGYIRNHAPHGDTLYIVDICVVPDMRKAGIGKWLMQSMYETVVHLRLKRLLGGGRMPGYHRCADTISPDEYLSGVVSGRFNDPVISFLLRCGRMPVGTAADYLEDEESRNYAALMEWKNPFHES